VLLLLLQIRASSFFWGERERVNAGASRRCSPRDGQLNSVWKIYGGESIDGVVVIGKCVMQSGSRTIGGESTPLEKAK